MITTPLAGRVAFRFGTRRALWGGLLLALAGMPLLLLPSLTGVLSGMVLVGIGTFFAQTIGTGFVGRAARSDRAAGSALYLASYYLGGLAGAAAIGQLFDRYGWSISVLAIAVSLAVAGLLALQLRAS